MMYLIPGREELEAKIEKRKLEDISKEEERRKSVLLSFVDFVEDNDAALVSGDTVLMQWTRGTDEDYLNWLREALNRSDEYVVIQGYNTKGIAWEVTLL